MFYESCKLYATSIELFDEVELIAEIEDEPVKVGDRGILVDFLKSDGVAAEFFDEEDNTITVSFISIDKIKKVQSGERVESKS